MRFLQPADKTVNECIAIRQYLFDLFDVFLLRVALLSLGDQLVRGALLLLLLPPHELFRQVGVSERINVVRVPTGTNVIRTSGRAVRQSART